MKLRPLGDRILVKRSDAVQQTEGGIFLPGGAAEKPKEGEVVAVGPGKVLDDGSRSPMSVQKGDMVVFTSYAGTEVKVGTDEFLVMREDDLLGTLEGSAKLKTKKARK